jgi:L-ribulose-5-phosphate 4-epimerase
MLEKIKEKVCEANLELVKYCLVIFTWGNVSEIDRESGYVVIKPSGVSYDNMKPEDMVVVDLEGNVIEGRLKPSSDMPTHLELYKQYKEIKGIVHTHSKNATSWAQSGRDVKAYGTTHADYFYGDIPCTRALSKEEVESAYEKNTGLVIIEKFKNINPMEIPAVLVKKHGPFAWGKDCLEAVHNAKVLEEICEMATYTEIINAKSERAEQYMLDKHFLRKHGKNAYYGQQKK